MKKVIQRIWSFLKWHKEAILLIAAILAIAGFIITDIRGILKDYLELQVEKKEIDFLFSMKQKCREEGKKIIEQQEEKILCSYEYTYNSKLHTCLLYYNCGAEKWVKDIFTNEELISYNSVFDETSVDIIPSEEGLIKILPPHFISYPWEFDVEKKKLFNQ